MNSVKNAIVTMTLLAVGYGAYVVLSNPVPDDVGELADNTAWQSPEVTTPPEGAADSLAGEPPSGSGDPSRSASTDPSTRNAMPDPLAASTGPRSYGGPRAPLIRSGQQALPAVMVSGCGGLVTSTPAASAVTTRE